MPEFDHVTILGPGLLGGSLGMAIRQKKIASRVTVWGRRQEAIDETLRLGAADAGTLDLSSAVKDCDLAVLCTPTPVYATLLPALQRCLPAHAVLTDVGSVKANVCNKIENVLGGRFIGSHPMTGSEKSGIGYARQDLFDGATCVITPTEFTTTSALDAAEILWKSVGCTLIYLSPAEHDSAVAYLSHLPHLIAAILANTSSKTPEKYYPVAGPGFRDTTRVASGQPEMWADILLDNRAEVATALSAFISYVEEFSTALRDANREKLTALLTSARVNREAILSAKKQNDRHS